MAEPSETAPQKSIYDVPMDLPGEKPRKKLPPLKKPLKLIVIILMIAVLGFGAWKLFGSKDSNKTSSPQTKQSTSEATESSATKEYESAPLSLKLNYPESWKVAEAEGGVRFTSPNFTYQSVSNEQVDGHFRVYIRQGARDVDGKYIGRGVAIKPSEKLAYSDPLQGQLKTTYLTSFGYDKTDNFAFFLIAGNFNLKTGETLGPNFGNKPEDYIIAGGYSSDELKDDLQMNMVPVDGYDQTDAYKQAVDIVKSLQLR